MSVYISPLDWLLIFVLPLLAEYLFFNVLMLPETRRRHLGKTGNCRKEFYLLSPQPPPHTPLQVRERSFIFISLVSLYVMILAADDFLELVSHSRNCNAVSAKFDTRLEGGPG